MDMMKAAFGLLETYIQPVVGALALFFFAWLVSNWIQRLVAGSLRRAKIDETLTLFLSKFTRWTVRLLAVLACLSVFGVEPTSFAAVLAAAGFAIGLAFHQLDFG